MPKTQVFSSMIISLTSVLGMGKKWGIFAKKLRQFGFIQKYHSFDTIIHLHSILVLIQTRGHFPSYFSS